MKAKVKTLAIIGGGAGGLFAAALLVDCQSLIVTILEKTSRTGRKILMSGNGRCNLSNTLADASRYDNGAFAAAVLANLGPAETLSTFASFGLETRTEGERVYPYGETAASVLDVLRNKLTYSVIEEKCNFNCVDIRKTGDGFVVKSEDGAELTFDYAILACGSGASVKDYDALGLAKKCGLGIVKPNPVLVPLRTVNNIKQLAGLRAEARVSLYAEGKLIETRDGEVQFRDGAISGIVIFELSHTLITRVGHFRQIKLVMDFYKEKTDTELDEMLTARQRRGVEPKDLLTGVFNRKLAEYIVKDAAGNGELIRRIKRNEFIITDTLGFSEAQASSGGVSLAGIDPDTCQTPVDGLYCIGEMLDVAGTCGGFNLQFAWSSAYAAARSLRGRTEA
ncbi:MAG: aminoacetone oxidase family FAD-binding enzyme [Clostridiales bacterium]|jgi:predicted Rossmann fold flavoprotein|nr:aminoacetone oxidase family FAD-binding enzyme [Clostridiales bacterium]